MVTLIAAAAPSTAASRRGPNSNHDNTATTPTVSRTRTKTACSPALPARCCVCRLTAGTASRSTTSCRHTRMELRRARCTDGATNTNQQSTDVTLIVEATDSDDSCPGNARIFCTSSDTDNHSRTTHRIGRARTTRNKNEKLGAVRASRRFARAPSTDSEYVQLHRVTMTNTAPLPSHSKHHSRSNGGGTS